MALQRTNTAGVQAKLAFARQKFHAWWEGYEFDDAVERAAIEAQFLGQRVGKSSPKNIVAASIWGVGRFEPGAPVWTMRFARMLSLPVRANVIVFGAGGGAPLSDLKHGTRWKLTGLTRDKDIAHGDLKSYDDALQRLNKGVSAGALSFFDMHRDADPLSFARFASELLLPGAKAVFIDYAVARKGARLRSCFPEGKQGTPKTQAEVKSDLQEAGFSVSNIVDETSVFLPLVATGWAGWRRAYSAIATIENTRMRAEFARAMAVHADLWAERFDAMKSGQLQVLSFQATRN